MTFLLHLYILGTVFLIKRTIISIAYCNFPGTLFFILTAIFLKSHKKIILRKTKKSESISNT